MTACTGTPRSTTPCTRLRHGWRRGLLALITLTALAACGGGGSDGPDATGPGAPNPPVSDDASGNEPAPGDGTDPLPPAPDDDPDADTLALSGFVIDGPVSGAEVRVRDAQGEELAHAISDAHARFDVTVPKNAEFPLVITATGGTNLTTAADPGFPITGFIVEAGQRQVVLSSLSTLVVAAADCSGDSTTLASNLSDADAALRILERHGFGLDATGRAQLLHAVPTTSAEAGSLLLAAEALGETLRRAAAALHASDGVTQANDVLQAVACPETRGDVGTAETSDRLGAAFHAAASSVLVETSIGELWVRDGTVDAVPKLQQAIASTFGGNGDFAIPDLPMHADAVEQVLRSVHAALGAAPSEELFDLYASLLALEHGTKRGALRAYVPTSNGLRDQLSQLLAAVNDDPELARDLLAWHDVEMNGTPPPSVDLLAAPRNLASRGGSTTLSHHAEHATLCLRTGGSLAEWAGVSAAEAELTVGPINGIETFGLHCAGPGGLTEQQVEVTVPPHAEVRFVNVSGTNPDTIVLGDTVRVELDVADVSVEQCEMTRTDTGNVIAHGSEIIATSGLGVSVTCDGLGGTVMSSASLPLRNTHIVWRAPTRLENGDPLTNLAGFRIYYGSSSRNYDGFVAIDDPGQIEHTEAFPESARYFALTAVTSDGLESSFSNEAYRSMP